MPRRLATGLLILIFGQRASYDKKLGITFTLSNKIRNVSDSHCHTRSGARWGLKVSGWGFTAQDTA